jgi:hypothetical protein
MVNNTHAGEERAAYLDWICRLLWPEPAHVSLTRSGRERSDSIAPPAANSVERTGELIVLPRRADPRLLLPTQRRAAAAAVRHYGEPGSRSSSLRKWATWLSVTSNTAPSLFRDRLRIDAPGDSPTIASYLREALGRDFCLSMYVSDARANRKPVLQLLTAQGEAMGFAKIGVDPLTRQLVRAERDALSRLATVRLSTIAVPRVLHHGSWNGLEVLVLTPLPVMSRRRAIPQAQLLAAMREVSAVAGVAQECIAGAGHWQRLLDGVASAPGGPQRARLESALEILREQGGEAVLSYGSWHGDWSPWNMASTRGALLVWDWERFSPGVPLGFDALHYWLRTEVWRKERNPASAARELITRAANLLGPFKVDAREARLTALLYLAELAARDLADRQEDAGARLGSPGGWLIPAITSELAQVRPANGPSRPTRLAQAVSLTPGRVSFSARMLPAVVIVGAQRCGTTTLYGALSDHPGVLPAARKEVHYFDVAYERGMSWYRAHFPLTGRARRIERTTGISPLAFEASPYYMFHPLACERIARDLPDVKVLVLIRDPVERAHSAHAHESALGFETQPFEVALELEDVRLEGEVQRILSDPRYTSYSHQHHAYRARGQYIEQLEHLEGLFGRERIHVIDSGDFFADPERTYDAILEFLELPNCGYPPFEAQNVQPRRPMPEPVRLALEAHFAPFDARLAKWLGWVPSWRRQPRMRSSVPAQQAQA